MEPPEHITQFFAWTGPAGGRTAERTKRAITFRQPVLLTPSYSAVTLYDARGVQIGTVDPITRVRTLVERPTAVPREDPVPCGLRLRPDIADPVKKLQRQYWESLALAAFGMSAIDACHDRLDPAREPQDRRQGH